MKTMANEKLAQQVNNLSTYFEMSDSPKVYDENKTLLEKIKPAIKKMNKPQKTKFFNSLSVIGQANFNRYFRKIS